jgi:hypothetical protein
MAEMYVVFERALDVHRRLLAAGVPNAIGGALALGYHVDEPRGTQDIDVNISLPADQARTVLELLPPDVPWDDASVQRIERDEQIRLMWPVEGEFPLPLDLFFWASELHAVVAARTIEVPMAGSTVHVLSATDLTIFKALFNRSKDWPDIEAMLTAHDSTVDLEDAIAWVASIVGDGDVRTERLRSLRQTQQRPPR